MKRKLLFGAATVALAAGYVINDNEFRLAFDRYYKFPEFIGKNDEDTTREIEMLKERGIQFINSVENEYVMIRNSQNNMITATFVPAKEKSNKYMILSHGYRYDGLHEFGLFYPFYYEENINLLIVDHQAHGSSEGKYITFGYQEHLDLLRWVDYLIENHGSDIDIYMHGVSMGAATVCQCAGSEYLQPQVKGIISDCAYINAKKQLIHTMEMYHAPLKDTTYHLIAKKLESRCNAKLDEVNALEAVKKCKVPMLFIHGMQDTFVPTNDSVELFDACACEDKDLLLVEKAGHAQCYWFAKDRYQQALLEMINK